MATLVTSSFTSGSTLTIIRGSRDSRTGGWVESERHDITPVGVDPSASAEAAGFQDTVTADRIVYAPYGADVKATDRAIIDRDENTLFDVNGDPANWRDPFNGDEVGCVIRLVHHRG